MLVSMTERHTSGHGQFQIMFQFSPPTQQAFLFFFILSRLPIQLFLNIAF